MIYVIARNRNDFRAFVAWMQKSSIKNSMKVPSLRFLERVEDLSRPNSECICVGPYWESPNWNAIKFKILNMTKDKFVSIQWFPLSGSPSALPA